jgi:hypothetical protein
LIGKAKGRREKRKKRMAIDFGISGLYIRTRIILRERRLFSFTLSSAPKILRGVFLTGEEECPLVIASLWT